MSENSTRPWRAVPAAVFVLALLGSATPLPASGGGTPYTPAPVPGPRLFVYRVATPGAGDVQRLLRGEWDVLEAKGNGFLLVQGEEDLPLRLALEGFSSELLHEVDRSGGEGLFTFYGGYRTAVEHEQHLAQVAAARPELALLVDYGDSWRRQQGLPNGHDLLALCLTNRQAGDCALSPTAPKPRAFVMANVHAREITTSELAWRFVDDLVARYGVDADVTALLDHTEVWVAPMTNPDGHEIVESGGNNPYLQRKNANSSLGGCTVPNQGVDLNRNANFYWGTSGSSTSPCASTYQGTAAASEPEVTALQSLMALLFADRKGPNLSDPVPPDATGTMVTLHSASELVLWPYGHAYVTAPNDAELKSLAFRMSYYNAY